MLIESAKNDSGDPTLGYILPLEIILQDLKEHGVDIGLSAARTEVAVPLTTIKLSYPVDDTLTDHVNPLDLGIQPFDVAALLELSQTGIDKVFTHKFAAQDGFKIIDASFREVSANKVREGPQIQISSDGTEVELTYKLASGPIYDQWRGWMSGNLFITEEKSNAQ